MDAAIGYVWQASETRVLYTVVNQSLRARTELPTGFLVSLYCNNTSSQLSGTLSQSIHLVATPFWSSQFCKVSMSGHCAALCLVARTRTGWNLSSLMTQQLYEVMKWSKKYNKWSKMEASQAVAQKSTKRLANSALYCKSGYVLSCFWIINDETALFNDKTWSQDTVKQLFLRPS